MSEKLSDHLQPLGRACRTVAFALIAGFCRRLGHDEVAARIARRPAGEQAMIVAAALAALALTSLLFAQFGAIGMLVFLLLVILIVN
jgi:hypothetical protein